MPQFSFSIPRVLGDLQVKRAGGTHSQERRYRLLPSIIQIQIGKSPCPEGAHIYSRLRLEYFTPHVSQNLLSMKPNLLIFVQNLIEAGNAKQC